MDQAMTQQASPVVELNAVSKSYRSVRSEQTTAVLQDISMDVLEGEFVALIGPSGCGKSTLLNMIAGLDQTTSGEIRVAGEVVAGPSADRGMMFQDYALFPWKSVAENISFGLDYGPHGRGITTAEKRERVDHFIKLVGLAGSEKKYPHELSGGMRQRCALARLFAYDPRVLLMDEPLAAVDAQQRRVLQEELLRIWGQDRPQSDRKTVIYVTHAIEEAVFLADRVFVMKSHPGQITRVMEIDLPRPRVDDMRSESVFTDIADTIWALIKEEAYRAALVS